MNRTTVLAALAAVAIGAGCSRTDTTETPAVEAPAAAGEWAPEEAAAPAAHDATDGGDHTGHDH